MERFLGLLCFLFCLVLKAQTLDQKPEKNLVPNSSFENYRKPSSDIRRAIPWRQIESVDYYQTALKNDTTADKGAYAGNCYAGFRFRKKYKEFLVVKLVEPLHRGTVYEYTMEVRLAFWSSAVLRSFGALFSKGLYTGQKDAIRSSMVDTINEKDGLHNDFRWFTVRGFYKADGGEKYLTIGNFSPLIKKDMMRINVFKFGPKEAYYFLDDIRLVKAKQFEEKIAVERVGPNYQENWEDSTLVVNDNIGIGGKVTLNHISFVNGKYYLLPESYAELNKLATYLQKNPHLEIRINGHSDNTGLNFKNQRISELRAREVFEYLIKRGVQNKMYFKGFGSSQPIADNNTEEGRQKNRRVEFEIIKK